MKNEGFEPVITLNMKETWVPMVGMLCSKGLLSKLPRVLAGNCR